MIVDHDLSRRVAQFVGIVSGDCWRNAWRAVASYPDLSDALYVEGWIASREMPHEIPKHAWVEMGERIIDPTIPEAPFAYFPVLRLTIAESLQKMLPDGTCASNCGQITEQDLRERLPIAMDNSDYQQISDKVRDEALEWRRKSNTYSESSFGAEGHNRDRGCA